MKIKINVNVDLKKKNHDIFNLITKKSSITLCF